MSHTTSSPVDRSSHDEGGGWSYASMARRVQHPGDPVSASSPACVPWKEL